MANVNFLYDDIVHALQNTIECRINSATDRRVYVLERSFTKFSEMTQCNGHYAVRGHSKSVNHRFSYQSKAHIRLPGGAENAGVENAGVENAGVDRTEGKCRIGKYRSDNVGYD